MKRTVSTVCVLGALLLGASAAQAANANACWNRALERMDYLADPPEHGDNNFFTTVVAQTGNVTLLYPAKQSMLEFTQRLYRIRVDKGGPTPTGCGNEYLNGLNYFMPTDVAAPAGAANLQGHYNPSTTYPDPETTYTNGGSHDRSDGFTSNKFYQYQQWPAEDSGTAQTDNAACTSALGVTGVGHILECKACLASNGYYLNPNAADNDTSPAAGIFSGNWLNFHPPKWALLKLAYKRLMNGPLLLVLREAVVAPSAASGATVTQKMLPSSCNGSGRPLTPKLAAVDTCGAAACANLNYHSTANPLSEMMLNVAWYMGGQQTNWWFAEGSFGSSGANGNSGPCTGCNSDFEVIFSDGRSDAANPSCIAAGNPAFCNVGNSCSTVGMGQEQDGDDFLNPAVYGDIATAITGASVRQTPGGTCDMDFADDVAAWMNVTNSAKPTGVPAPPAGTVSSKIKTYVVAVGDPLNTYGEMTSLQAVAAAGSGLYVVAEDFATLEANIEQVFNDILRRATSFSVAAISTVQTRGSTFAFIPRFRPLAGAQWEGRLLRFNLFNEFSAGCTSVDYGTKNARNPNGDNSCNDVYLQDLNNNFVGEDVDGSFVLLDTSQPYDAGWPVLTTTLSDGGTATTPAVPIWEASAVLSSRENAVISGTSTDVRNIFTVAQSGSGAGTYSSTAVPLTVSNVSAITPLIQVGGYQGDFCTELQGITRHTYAADDDCTADVIRFLNGEDVMTQNPLNRVSPPPNPRFARPNILGDIFHSSPVLVQPPVETFLCDFGVANQCLATLYNSATPLASAAYTTFQGRAGVTDGGVARDEFVLVGADDGMVHAFHAGSFSSFDSIGQPNFDLGTGREIWAFVPPDMMAKVQRYVLNTRHEVLVDGTAMVRDIWVDGSGTTVPVADRQKQADEFHTIAIFGEREGGRHFFALDVTDVYNPKYLWSFPPTGSAQALEMGESWDDVAPGAPAIGPIAVLDEPATGPQGPYQVNGHKASERWVFAFGGGFDPSFVRGRGIFVIDAWTGEQIFQYRQIDATSSTDPRSQLWPVSAPVSMVDTDGDGLFDQLVVPDTGGQVWTISMLDPGHDVANNGLPGSGLFTNWLGARSFIEAKSSALYHRHPFNQRAAVARISNPGAAGLVGTTGPIYRVMLGSGDRDQIKDGNGGTCGLANLGACLRKDCTVDVVQNTYRVGPAPQGGSGGHFYDGEWKDSSGNATTNPQTFTADTLSQQSNCTDPADVNIQYNITCGGALTTFNDQAYCDWGAGIDGGTDCPVNTGRPIGSSVPYTSIVAMEPSKFYSYTLFDMSSTGSTPTGKRTPFTNSTDANNWDANLALTETNLVDVTTDNNGVKTCIAASTCLSTSTTGQNNVLGWFIRHVNTVTGQTSLPGDEKTSASALVLGGCALWQTLLPTSVQETCEGLTLPADNGFAYQSDVALGTVACGASGGSTVTSAYRSVRSDTIVAPQEATPVVSINAATHQTMISGISLPVGAQPIQVNLGVGLPQGTVHWLELTPAQHGCRHNGTGCTQ